MGMKGLMRVKYLAGTFSASQQTFSATGSEPEAGGCGALSQAGVKGFMMV